MTRPCYNPGRPWQDVISALFVWIPWSWGREQENRSHAASGEEGYHGKAATYDGKRFVDLLDRSVAVRVTANGAWAVGRGDGVEREVDTASVADGEVVRRAEG